MKHDTAPATLPRYEDAAGAGVTGTGAPELVSPGPVPRNWCRRELVPRDWCRRELVPRDWCRRELVPRDWCRRELVPRDWCRRELVSSGTGVVGSWCPGTGVVGSWCPGLVSGPCSRDRPSSGVAWLGSDVSGGWREGAVMSAGEERVLRTNAVAVRACHPRPGADGGYDGAADRQSAGDRKLDSGGSWALPARSHAFYTTVPAACGLHRPRRSGQSPISGSPPRH